VVLLTAEAVDVPAAEATAGPLVLLIAVAVDVPAAAATARLLFSALAPGQYR
jgi:hypothetical protein